MKTKSHKPTILIDIKRQRVRIYKQTLYMLGTPNYIELLVNPDKSYVAIRTTENRTNLCHKINWDKIIGKNSFEITSKYFIEKLTGICDTTNSSCSYRIIGSYVPCENLVCFDMKNAFPISENTEE